MPIDANLTAVADGPSVETKRQKGFSLPLDVYERLAVYAKQTKRTLAGAVDWCVEHQAGRDGVILTPQTETAVEQ